MQQCSENRKPLVTCSVQVNTNILFLKRYQQSVRLIDSRYELFGKILYKHIRMVKLAIVSVSAQNVIN